MRCARLLALLVLLAAGCNHPFQVVTSGRIQADMPPVLDRGPVREMTIRGGTKKVPTVALIDVDGLLLNMDMTGFLSLGENPVNVFREKLDCAAVDPCVQALVVRINTPGGGVTATDIMWRELVAFKARKPIPVVAVLMDVAAGGGYYLATAADQIVAHPTSITGGVGVILNLYNLQDTMAQFNVVGVPVRAGENIDLGSPVKPLTPESRQLLQTMADEFHTRFRQVVATARPATVQLPAELFDGRVFTAQQAATAGLIDQIGYVDDALQLAEKLAGLSAARVILYHRQGDAARSAYAITPNVPLQSSFLPLSIPGLDRSKLPTFLYLWQPDPTLEKMGGR